MITVLRITELVITSHSTTYNSKFIIKIERDGTIIKVYPLRYVHKYVHTVGELKDWTKRHLWSKTTLNTGSMGGARVLLHKWRFVQSFNSPTVCTLNYLANLLSKVWQFTFYTQSKLLQN